MSSVAIAGGGKDRAEICAFHAAGGRLFVANSADRRVEVLDLSEPRDPRELPALDVAARAGGFECGSPNGVALFGDWLAVAVQAADAQAPGVLQFWDARSGELLKQVEVGALPDMVVFDAAGRRCLVANEGEPNDDYTVDPEGSVTIIELPEGGPTAIDSSHVKTVSFVAFNGRADELRRAGVRLCGPGASVAQDLEPEFIAVARDGSRAWVSCQENNALAILDLERAQVVDLVPLGTKVWSSTELVHDGELRWLDWPARPALGTAASGELITLGGFSGLAYEGPGELAGSHRFLTTLDRGPDLGRVEVDGEPARVLALPHYRPRIVRFELTPEKGSVVLLEQIGLTRADGSPVTGRPNLLATREGLAFHDERILDPARRALELDPLGADFEGVVKAPDGTYWLADEYRPSLFHFDVRGRLLARYVPRGSNAHGATVGREVLPRVYAARRFNRGFEALALDESNGRVYAWLQSPLDNPDTPDDRHSKASRLVRVVEFDPRTETVSGEFVHVLDGGRSDKLAAACWSGVPGEFLVLERDARAGEHAIKNIYSARLEGATNLSRAGQAYEALAGVGGVLESTEPVRLAALSSPVVPLRKTLFLNLVEAGYHGLSKPEGMARLPDGRLLLVNDDDFALRKGAEKARLALVRPLPAGLDVDDTDGGTHLDPWPVRSLYQPDAVVAFERHGATWIVTANEGERRDYPGTPGFADSVRAGELELDADRARGLARLVVERPDLGPGGPGAALPTSFGARSFSIWTDDGRLVFDSGAGLTRQLLRAGVDPAFDHASDEHGVEPESLALGELGDYQALFVGLEGAGGVAVYYLDNPHAPTFATYIETPGHRDPEGLCFIPAADSPSGMPLLVICHAESGTVTIHELAP